MVAVTLDFFSRVDASYGILLNLLLRDSVAFCVVTCAHFLRGHT
jgi:hypothetical protein